jgi:transposase-like protein
VERPRKYPVELIERAVRLVFESGRPIAHVARKPKVRPASVGHAQRLTERRQDRTGRSRHDAAVRGEVVTMLPVTRRSRQLRLK